MFDVMSRTVFEMSLFERMKFSTLRMELSTVEWLRPSYWSPMSARERFVRLRMRYMLICLASAVVLLRRCPRSSAGSSEKYLAVSVMMTSGVGM